MANNKAMAATVFSPPRLRSQGFEGGKNRRLSITTMYLESKSTVHFEASARFFGVSRKNCKALQLSPPWYLPCCHLNLGAPNQTTRPCRKSAWRAAWPWTDEHLRFGTWHFEMIDSLGNLHIYSPKTKIAPWKQHISKATIVFQKITVQVLH